MKWISVVAVVFFLFNQKVHAEKLNARTVLEIMEHQPDSIEIWTGDKVYLCPERIQVKRTGVFVNNRESSIQIPKFFSDENGIFMKCSVEEVNQEAKEHFDKAWEALIDAAAHAAAAALFVEQCPPLAVYEGYKSVEAFKTFGNEYSAGVDCESNTIKND